MRRWALIVVVLLSPATYVCAQSTATIEGLVTDQSGALITSARITARNPKIGISRTAVTDNSGRYQIPALPVGDYELEINATGFQTQLVQSTDLDVGRRVTRDWQLQVGDVSQQVTVTTAGDQIERTTSSVGHVIDRRMVQQIPLNGRYFLDLGLLAPGSVVSPQGAFGSAPMRGLGALTINTAGNREETIN